MTHTPFKARRIAPFAVVLAAVLVFGLAGCDNPAGSEDTLYTVTFDSQGGSVQGGGAVPDQSVPKGGKVTAPALVAKDGNIFGGWHKEAAFTSLWDFDTDTVTGAITLYAKWTPVEAGNWVVNFDAQGGAPAPAAQAVPNNGRASAPSPVPVKEGYLLEGWHRNAAGTGSAWNFASGAVTEDLILYAKWTPVEAGQVVVTFDAAGGSPVPAQRAVDSGSRLARPSNPAKTGYDFAGWFAAAEGGTAWDFAEDTATEHITLYARWTVRQYVVSFNSRGGGAVESQTVAHGGAVALPEPPENGSMVLEGWYREAGLATKWDFDADTVTGALTLYARWLETPPGTYLVAFNSQGGSAVESQIVADQGKVAKPEPPTRSGYVFAAWRKTASGAEAWDFDADTISGPTTLYAGWTQAYTVAFDSGDGSAVASLIVAAGATIAKPADPTLAGCVFDAWHREAALATKWDFDTATVTGNITLYAGWTVQVSFSVGGGAPAPAAQTLARGSLVAKPAVDPVLAGKTFMGWHREAAGTNLWDFAVDRANAATSIHAKWEFVPVTKILNVPEDGIWGTVDLGAAAVQPDTASYKTIVWSLTDAGGTGAVLSGASVASIGANGTIKLTATVSGGGANGGNYTEIFSVSISQIRSVTGIGGITAGTGLAKGSVVDLNKAAAQPSNATNRTIVWTVKTAGAGVTTIPGDQKLTLSALGTLVLTATIADGDVNPSGALIDYTEDFSFTVDKATAPGDVGFGDAASIKLYANGGTEPLSADSAVRVVRESEYYIEIAAGYSNVAWYLDGNRSTVTGGKLYLDTGSLGTVVVTVEAEQSSVWDDSSYTFIIE